MTPAVAAAALLALALGLSPRTAGGEGRGEGGSAPGWFDVRSFGGKGDGVADDSRALQAALDAAREAGGGVVHVPAGTWIIAPPPGPRGRPALGSITIGSNVWLRGDGPATVLKVKAGTGSYRALLSNHPDAGSAVENVRISDLRVDQSCAASGASIEPGGDAGRHLVVYLAWGGRNLSVERVTFDPVCGVNTVVMNAPDARNLAVRDSTFRFVRGPAASKDGFYDNTAVYVHGDGALVTGNVFESTPRDGARGAIELHGRNGIASANVTRGYASCVRVVGSSGGEPPVRGPNGFTVAANTCADAKDAINVWPVTGHGVRGVTIAGNTIRLAELDHLAAAPAQRWFSGISFVWDAVSGGLDGDVADVVIEGNTISGQRAEGAWGADAPGTGGIVLGSAGNISNVLVRGNVVRDVSTTGIHLEARGHGAARSVRIEGNVIVDPGSDPSAGFARAGIVLAGRLEDVEVARNTIAGTAVPFRGRFAIEARPAPGSARVGIHDNAWTSADRSATYAVSLAGPGLDAGPDGRTRALAVAPRRDDVVELGPGARIVDLTVESGEPFCVRAPRDAVPGQRLTIRVRNGSPGPLGAVDWSGFKLAPWTSPAPRHQRVLEVVYDGAAWSELFQSPRDVPN